MYGSRVAILNNGVKMAEQEWGVEHAPNIDINNYQHIDVVKASALKFGGDAIGGLYCWNQQYILKRYTGRKCNAERTV